MYFKQVREGPAWLRKMYDDVKWKKKIMTHIYHRRSRGDKTKHGP